MIKANLSKHVFGVFSRYIDYILKSDFHEIKVIGEWNKVEKSCLIIGNHISWWDGFFGMYLNNLFLKKKYHFMMLEEQLRVQKIFPRIGAFSINPGTRDVLESLHYTAGLLNNKENSVLMFPQGKIHSIYYSTFIFKRGIEKILKLAPQTQLLFYAAFIDYFSNRKPTLFFYLKEVSVDKELQKNNLQLLYQSFYDESLAQHSKLNS